MGILTTSSIHHNYKAVLLLSVASFFDSYFPCREKDDSEILIDLNDDSINFSSRWLLHQLIIHPQPYMAYNWLG